MYARPSTVLAVGLLVVSMGERRLLHHDGRVELATTDMQFANGPFITPDGRTLIVAESFAKQLTAFDIGAGGVLTERPCLGGPRGSFSRRHLGRRADESRLAYSCRARQGGDPPPDSRRRD